MHNQTIEIYTDGSCHTQYLIGAWAAIIFIDDQKKILSGVENNTTHNCMELMAVIKALDFIRQQNISAKTITIISDSQYVTGLQTREKKLMLQNFTTKKGIEIANATLVKKLLSFTNIMKVEFFKIKAHQKRTDKANYNIEADKLSRNLVRNAVKNLPLL